MIKEIVVVVMPKGGWDALGCVVVHLLIVSVTYDCFHPVRPL